AAAVFAARRERPVWLGGDCPKPQRCRALTQAHLLPAVDPRALRGRGNELPQRNRLALREQRPRQRWFCQFLLLRRSIRSAAPSPAQRAVGRYRPAPPSAVRAWASSAQTLAVI